MARQVTNRIVLGAVVRFRQAWTWEGLPAIAERIDAQKVRARSASFFDHFSQATLFYNSQSEPEKKHIIERCGLNWERSRRRRFGNVCWLCWLRSTKGLRLVLRKDLGAKVPAKLDKPMNMSIPGGADPRKFQPKQVAQEIETSPALRMVNNPNFPNDSIKTRKIAVLIADGFDDAAVDEMNKALLTAGAMPKTIAPRLGVITGAGGVQIKADFSFLTASSVLFDAVFVPGGDASVATLSEQDEVDEFVSEAYKHCKAIAATGAGAGLLATTLVGKYSESDEADDGVAVNEGVVTSREGSIKDLADAFVAAIALHRHWEREPRS